MTKDLGAMEFIFGLRTLHSCPWSNGIFPAFIPLKAAKISVLITGIGRPKVCSGVVFRLFMMLLVPGPRPRRFGIELLSADTLAGGCWDMFVGRCNPILKKSW